MDLPAADRPPAGLACGGLAVSAERFLVCWFGMAFMSLAMLSMGMPVWVAVFAELAFLLCSAYRVLRVVLGKRWQYRVAWSGDRSGRALFHFFDTRLGASLCMRWLRWRGFFVRVNGERFL